MRFAARISDDGDFTPRPFRYHVYGGWLCSSSHRVAITRELAGLHDIVSMSYVDGDRDGRGWAFRKRYGPDPVNGFTLLRQAYEATEDGFDGHVDVPTLWDRFTAQVVSIDATGIEVDLATRFRHLTEPVTELYPDRLRDRIDHLDAWIGPATGADAERDELLEAYARLAGSRYLLGAALTLADVRLWVRLGVLSRDVGPGVTTRSGVLDG